MKRAREESSRPFLTKLDQDIIEIPFNIWLKKEKGKDVQSVKDEKKISKYFEKFRNKFNNNELERIYYELFELQVNQNEPKKIKTEEEFKIEKAKEKLYLKNRKSDLEELVPKPDPGSFLAKKQKNKAKYFRDDSPDPGDSTYDNRNNFENLLEKQKTKKMEKILENERIIAEIKEKERKKMEEFKKNMNLNKFTK
jgi:hypothetical protein